MLNFNGDFDGDGQGGVSCEYFIMRSHICALTCNLLKKHLMD